MSVPHPRECAHDTDRYSEVCNDTHYEDRVVIILVVDEDDGDAED